MGKFLLWKFTVRTPPSLGGRGPVEASSFVYEVTIDRLALRQTKGTYRLMLATLLHERTTVRQTWIAKKLFMGSAATVCQQSGRFNQRGLRAPDLQQ